MSMIAADRTENVAVAQTLCSLAPVLIVPVVAVVYRERISLRSILGTLLAFAGAAMLVSASVSVNGEPRGEDPSTETYTLDSPPEAER
jgi:drug/metabolite transporter (DMT)-like permease